MQTHSLNRSDIVNLFASKHKLPSTVTETVTNTILDQMSQALAHHQRIEIRGFGTFAPKQRKAHQARNPRTGETITTQDKYSIHFKPGQEFKKRVDTKVAR